MRDAAQRFASLGATVEDISVPTHAQGFPVWAAIRGDAACVTLLEMNGAGINHEGLYVLSLMDKAMAWRSRADDFADTIKIASIFSKYTVQRYGGRYYGKAQNIRRRLRAAYDTALAAHDLLLLPTTPMKATPIPKKGATPQEITRRSWEATGNTCPFNVTGHPAISLPCGMEDGRPIGMMLVGRAYDEATIYRAAAAFERFGRLDEILSSSSLRGAKREAIQRLLLRVMDCFVVSLLAMTRQPSLMLANLTTFAHFSVSSARNLPNAAAVMGAGEAPRSARLACTLASARPAPIAPFNVATMSAGVFAGAPTPAQPLELVARHRVGHRRHIRQRRRARRRGHRDGAHFAGADMARSTRSARRTSPAPGR